MDKEQTEKMSVKTNFPAYKTVSTDSLVPYARNSRKHSEKQVEKIAASIREFGFINPVIIDGSNGIVAGHGRVMAAKKLGLREVPVIDASHLSESQKRAYVIADNRIALESEWDEEMLALELQEIGDVGFDVAITGFDDKELSKIFDETKGISIVDEIDEPEEQTEIVVKFKTEDQVEIINALASAISDFADATIWMNNEQV